MLEYFMYTYGNQILLVLLCAIFGTAGYGLKKLLGKYLDTATKQSVAETSMLYVDQVYDDLHGEEKMEKALSSAETLLNKYGIPFDAEEMRILIECAIKAFKAAYLSNE